MKYLILEKKNKTIKTVSIQMGAFIMSKNKSNKILVERKTICMNIQSVYV